MENENYGFSKFTPKKIMIAIIWKNIRNLRENYVFTAIAGFFVKVIRKQKIPIIPHVTAGNFLDLEKPNYMISFPALYCILF